MKAKGIIYFRNKFDQCKADSKGTWKVINALTKPKTSKTNSFRLNLPGEITDCPIKISNAFNNYFSSVVTNLAATIPPSDVHPVELINTNPKFFCIF